MKTYIMATIVTAGILNPTFFPSFGLITWLTALMLFDLVTGVIKAIIKGNARTSRGFQQSVIKFLLYYGAIFLAIALRHVASLQGYDSPRVLEFLTNGLIVFLIYIEVLSILENFNEMGKPDYFTKFLVRPAIKLMTFQLKNNPLFKGGQDTAASKKEKEVSNE